MIIISIYDNIAETFNGLALARNEKEAIRSFDTLETEPAFIDYTLWKLGEYDMASGEIVPCKKRLAEGYRPKENKE